MKSFAINGFGFTCVLLLIGSIVQIDSVSFINNQLVPSDIIQEQFLDEIRLGLNLSGIAGLDIAGSLKCVAHLREIVNQFPKLKAARFIDSWGKFPSGVLYGHLIDIGNYDECVDASLPIENTNGVINGQYCVASIPLMTGSPILEEDITMLRQSSQQPATRAISDYAKISLGICMPDTCDSNLMSKVFERIVGNIFNTEISGVTVSQCSVAKRSSFEALDIVAIVIFSLIGLLMALSTLYDWYTRYFEIKPVNLLLAFSILANAKKIFAINTKKSPNVIECLHGIRVLSMAWIVYGHNYMYILNLNLINLINVLSWYKAPVSTIVVMSNVSVDTFFLLSGILVAWLTLRELDRTKGKLNVIMMWIHRYIRLTPPIAALILFEVSLNKYVGTGPFRNSPGFLKDTCIDNWWLTLLYVQNYVSTESMCILQSWYLGIDTQLYILSPLILIPLWKWGKKFVPVMVILSLLSMAYVFATYIRIGYTNMGFSGEDWMKLIYFPTHTRFPVWLVGVGLAYLMYINKGKIIKPSKMVQLAGWVLSLGIIFSIIFAPYNVHETYYRATVGEAAAYESLKRVAWGIALGWIIFSSYFGFGGVISSFLSHPFWQPLSRLTYSFYLVHILVISTNFGIIRTDSYFSSYMQILNFWSSFGISFMVAIALSLSFEAPVLVLEKALFAIGKEKPKEKVESIMAKVAPTAPTTTSIEISQT